MPGALNYLMRALPNQAKAYILLIYIVGVAAALSSQLVPAPVSTAPDLRVESFGAVAAASLVYFGINTVGVSIVISLCTNQNWLKLWRHTFLWTAPSYFASASISTLACMLFKDQIGAVMVFGMPV